MSKWINPNQDVNRNFLFFQWVGFGVQRGEDVFFEWIERIDCIESVSGVGTGMYLNLFQRRLTKQDVREIMALCKRYKMDTEQLERFKWAGNENAFKLLYKKPFLITGFGLKKKITPKTVKLFFKPIKFYSALDRDMFFEWIKGITSVVRCDEQNGEICIYVKSKTIPYHDVMQLTGLWKRYRLQHGEQLQIFLNQDNSSMFSHPLAFWHRCIFGTKKNPKIFKKSL